MEKIRVLIVEDNLVISQGIAATLSTYGHQVAGMVKSGEEALLWFSKNTVDLILMDIELSGALDGISTAHFIGQQKAVPIIYLTDFVDEKTFLRAKKTFPSNYLSKPFLASTLLRAVDLAVNNHDNALGRKVAIEQGQVLLRTDAQAYVTVDIGEIIYLEARRAYCSVITTKGKHILSKSMNHVAEQIGSDALLRVHRSYIVNLTKITSLEGNVVRLGAHQVLMSKEYREALLGRLRIIK